MYNNDNYYYEKMCIVFIWINNVKCTYSTKKMKITVFMTIIENDNFKYS